MNPKKSGEQLRPEQMQSSNNPEEFGESQSNLSGTAQPGRGVEGSPDVSNVAGGTGVSGIGSDQRNQSRTSGSRVELGSQEQIGSREQLGSQEQVGRESFSEEKLGWRRPTERNLEEGRLGESGMGEESAGYERFGSAGLSENQGIEDNPATGDVNLSSSSGIGSSDIGASDTDVAGRSGARSSQRGMEQGRSSLSSGQDESEHPRH